jgi:hypothetical protein
MKRIAWLFVVALCSVTFVHAQSSGKAKECHGTVCRSTCVSQLNNVATCDPECTVKTGDLVFVDDNGTLTPIAQESQNMCESHVGKHVTMMAVPTEQGREQIYRIQEIRNDSGAG